MSGPVATTARPSRGGGQSSDLLAPDLDQRLRRERGLDRAGEAVPVHGQRRARRQLVRIARGHDQRAQPAHLRVQEADRVVERIIGAERVGADQLGQPAGLVRLGRAHRAHLVHHDRDAGARRLPGGLAAGQTAADHMDGRHGNAP